MTRDAISNCWSCQLQPRRFDTSVIGSEGCVISSKILPNWNLLLILQDTGWAVRCARLKHPPTTNLASNGSHGHNEATATNNPPHRSGCAHTSWGRGGREDLANSVMLRRPSLSESKSRMYLHHASLWMHHDGCTSTMDHCGHSGPPWPDAGTPWCMLAHRPNAGLISLSMCAGTGV